MPDNEKILIDQIIAAFQRIRALLFTMTLFCALILSNAYVERYSIDDAIIVHSGILEAGLRADQTKLLQDQKENLAQLSSIKARLARIENNMDEYKYRTLTVPIIGMTLPANDANVVLGIFLAILAIWILYSIHQVRDALDEANAMPDVRHMFPILRHAAVFVYKPPEVLFKSVLANAMFALPAITMFLVIAVDYESIINLDHKEILNDLQPIIITRMMVLVVIALILTYVGNSLVNNRKLMTKMFYPDLA